MAVTAPTWLVLLLAGVLLLGWLRAITVGVRRARRAERIVVAGEDLARQLRAVRVVLWPASTVRRAAPPYDWDGQGL